MVTVRATLDKPDSDVHTPRCGDLRPSLLRSSAFAAPCKRKGGGDQTIPWSRRVLPRLQSPESPRFPSGQKRGHIDCCPDCAWLCSNSDIACRPSMQGEPTRNHIVYTNEPRTVPYTGLAHDTSKQTTFRAPSPSIVHSTVSPYPNHALSDSPDTLAPLLPR